MFAFGDAKFFPTVRYSLGISAHNPMNMNMMSCSFKLGANTIVQLLTLKVESCARTNKEKLATLIIIVKKENICNQKDSVK